jgi:hypothetical protein
VQVEGFIAAPSAVALFSGVNTSEAHLRVDTGAHATNLRGMVFRFPRAAGMSAVPFKTRPTWSADASLRGSRFWCGVTAALLMGGLLQGCAGEPSDVAEGPWTPDPALVGHWLVEAPPGVATGAIAVEFHADGRLSVGPEFEAAAWTVSRRVDDRICIAVLLAHGTESWWATVSPDGRSMQLDTMPGVWLRRTTLADEQSEE